MNYPYYLIDGESLSHSFEISRRFVEPEFRWKNRMLILFLIVIMKEFGEVPIVGATTTLSELKKMGGVKLIGFVRYPP